MNKSKTYLGALEVIEKILFGSKYLNIILIFKILAYFIGYLLWKNFLIKNEEGDNNEGLIIFTLDQN